MRLSICWQLQCLTIVAVCEIINYGLPNILNSNLWHFKWRPWIRTIWIKIGWRTYLVTRIRMQKLVLLGWAVCSEYIIVHFAQDGRTHILPARHLLWLYNYTHRLDVIRALREIFPRRFRRRRGQTAYGGFLQHQRHFALHDATATSLIADERNEKLYQL